MSQSELHVNWDLFEPQCVPVSLELPCKARVMDMCENVLSANDLGVDDISEDIFKELLEKVKDQQEFVAYQLVLVAFADQVAEYANPEVTEEDLAVAIDALTEDIESFVEDCPEFAPLFEDEAGVDEYVRTLATKTVKRIKALDDYARCKNIEFTDDEDALGFVEDNEANYVIPAIPDHCPITQIACRLKVLEDLSEQHGADPQVEPEEVSQKKYLNYLARRATGNLTWEDFAKAYEVLS